MVGVVRVPKAGLQTVALEGSARVSQPEVGQMGQQAVGWGQWRGAVGRNNSGFITFIARAMKRCC